VSEPVGAGPGRLLVAVYGIFAVAATSRAGLQLLTRFDEAPLAYLLSALAAVVYLVATVALARSQRRWARGACAFELTGVLVVGTVSLLAPDAFPDETVWSGYGAGYGFLPLLLPVLGLLRLRRTR
jgi:cytochrome bd-type quinol oxidase subunit 2